MSNFRQSSYFNALNFEVVDYVVFNNFVKNSKGGRTSIEYAITVTMAKELAMLKFEHRLKTTKKALFGVSFLF